MRLGMIGLGRMGANMARRLSGKGHVCVVYDAAAEAVRRLSGPGIVGTASLRELVAKLDQPRSVWVMVPADAAEEVVKSLGTILSPDDAIIDGGNGDYRRDAPRAALLKEKGVDLIDCGVSGGVHGLERGYCLMVGGDKTAALRLVPIFAALAPEGGSVYCGPSGAGHFVKMVHNGIEYGLMAAYAEGFNLLKNSDYRLDVPAIAETWRHGSVITSWLLDLAAQALAADPELEGFSGRVADSGEGRWTIETAAAEGIPAPTIAAALFGRFSSQDRDEFARRLQSALRHGFGGHV